MLCNQTTYKPTPFHLLALTTVVQFTVANKYVLLYTEHAVEVDAIVDRANKDIAIETLLNTFEEVWLSKHFDLQLHQRVAETGGQEVGTMVTHSSLDCTYSIVCASINIATYVYTKIVYNIACVRICAVYVYATLE